LARIEQAKADWKRDRFNVVVPGDNKEFIPSPEGKAPWRLTHDGTSTSASKKGGREDFARLPTLGPDTGALARR
jgi:hypothetical protein